MNQKRYINLLSNLYNNLSNVYLALKKTDKATEALHKAFEIRISYADTGIIETHDMLQQMLNLVNMLILAGDLELARLVLNQYDALVTDNEGYNTLDYGCCRLASGIIALKEGKPVEAEKNLLAAESIINTAMDTSDSDLASSDTAVSAFDNYVSILILFNVINIPFLNIFHIISIFTFSRIISTIKIPYIIITMSLHNR